MYSIYIMHEGTVCTIYSIIHAYCAIFGRTSMSRYAQLNVSPMK